MENCIKKTTAEQYCEKGKYYYSMAKELNFRPHLYKAIEYFEQAISIDPNYAEAHHGLSFCHAYLGNIEEAMKVAINANEKGKK